MAKTTDDDDDDDQTENYIIPKWYNLWIVYSIRIGFQYWITIGRSVVDKRDKNSARQRNRRSVDTAVAIVIVRCRKPRSRNWFEISISENAWKKKQK